MGIRNAVLSTLVSGIGYEHLLPWESARLSETGVAVGYEPLRFGEAHATESGDVDGLATLIATATVKDVTFQRELKLERKAYADAFDNHDLRAQLGIPLDGALNSDHRRKLRLRRRALQRRMDAGNTILWENLTRTNREYLLSLLWLPEKPVSPLMALARSLED